MTWLYAALVASNVASFLLGFFVRREVGLYRRARGGTIDFTRKRVGL